MYEREIARERLELLPQDFYRQDSLVVAPILIGCVVETNKKGVVTSGRITETEAYPGYDAASHAYKNKHTPRTEVQYLEGGRLYIYQIMGLHLMTSIVVGDKEIADVVFVRSIEPLEGLEAMKKRRKYYDGELRKLASGPGILSVALGITKEDNGIIVYKSSSPVRIYRDSTYLAQVDTGTRINLGIHDKDHEEARITMDRKWRFYNTNSLFISK